MFTKPKKIVCIFKNNDLKKKAQKYEMLRNHPNGAIKIARM